MAPSPDSSARSRSAAAPATPERLDNQLPPDTIRIDGDSDSDPFDFSASQPKSSKKKATAATDSDSDLEIISANIIPGIFKDPAFDAAAARRVAQMAKDSSSAVQENREAAPYSPRAQPASAADDILVASAPSTIFDLKDVFESRYGSISAIDANLHVAVLKKHLQTLRRDSKRGWSSLVADLLEFLVNMIVTHDTSPGVDAARASARRFAAAANHLDALGDVPLRGAKSAFETIPEKERGQARKYDIIVRAHNFWLEILGDLCGET